MEPCRLDTEIQLEIAKSSVASVQDFQALLLISKFLKMQLTKTCLLKAFLLNEDTIFLKFLYLPLFIFKLFYTR